MKRAIGILAAGAAMSGCGWYTDFPARIMVKSVNPSAVTIDYMASATSGGGSTTTVKYTQPTVTLEGAPGSIGATYNDLTIRYYTANASGSANGTAVSTINGGQAVSSSQTVRVESSALRSNYGAGNQDMVGLDPSAADSQKQPLIIGTAQWIAPIVTQDVIKYGSPSGGSAPGQIYAAVVLDGVDDAHFPAKLSFFIPIAFVNDTPSG